MQKTVLRQLSVARVYQEHLKHHAVAWSVGTDNAVVALEMLANEETQSLLLPLLGVPFSKAPRKVELAKNFQRNVIRSLAHITTLRSSAAPEVEKALIKALIRVKPDSSSRSARQENMLIKALIKQEPYEALFAIPALVALNSPKSWEALEKAAPKKVTGDIPPWPSNYQSFVEAVSQSRYDLATVERYVLAALELKKKPE